MDPASGPVQFLGLSEQVAGWLRDQILSGHLRDGDRIVERDVAAQLGVSRGPIRDALRQLQAEGLVHWLPRRGARVATLTRKDAVEVIAIRQALEPIAVRFLLQRRDPRLFDPFRDCLARLEQASGKGDWSALVTLDMEFHELTYRQAGSVRLERLWEGLRIPLLQTFRLHRQFYASGADVLRSHQELLDQLTRGDPQAAEAAARDHVVDLRDQLLEHMRQLEAADAAEG
jgi:DNA-binding GntR family transcriptional regulator